MGRYRDTRGSGYERPLNFDPFRMVELEVHKCLEENKLQVLCVFNVAGRTRAKWIPRGSIWDMIGGKLIVVGERVQKNMTYFKIRIPMHYAIKRGLWDPDHR